MERYQQRFCQFKKALQKLEAAVSYISGDTVQWDTPVLSDLMKQGLIQNFEFTHELAWKLMKDYAEYQSPVIIRGSRDAIREAFKMGLIQNGEIWMEMIQSRNETSHLYDEEIADEVYRSIIYRYLPALTALKAAVDPLM